VDTSTAVALISTVVAAVIAVTVPYMTFRLALRQDRGRWLREKKSLLYVDLLTEAYAERRVLEQLLRTPPFVSKPEDRAVDGPYAHLEDVRLGPVDRARLGARAAVFGNCEGNDLFNSFGQLRESPTTPDPSGTIAYMFDHLETAIRHELGADKINQGTAPDTMSTERYRTRLFSIIAAGRADTRAPGTGPRSPRAPACGPPGWPWHSSSSSQPRTTGAWSTHLTWSPWSAPEPSSATVP
jgi:hypothetical protein